MMEMSSNLRFPVTEGHPQELQRDIKKSRRKQYDRIILKIATAIQNPEPDVAAHTWNSRASEEEDFVGFMSSLGYTVRLHLKRKETNKHLGSLRLLSTELVPVIN